MLLSVVLIGVAGGVLYVLYKLHRPPNYAVMDGWRGPPLTPVIGVADLPSDAIGQTHYFLHGIKQYGSGCRLKLVNEYLVFIWSPAHVEAVLTSRENITKGFVYDLVKPWFGEGLLTSTDAVWHRQRKQLTPTFHFRVLEEYIPVINEQAATLADIIMKCVTAGNDDAIDVCPLLTRCTLDIICETAMGRSIDAQHLKSPPYLASLVGFTESVVERISRPLYWNDRLYALLPAGRAAQRHLRVLTDFTEETISEREKLLSDTSSASPQPEGESKKRRLTFMDLLLEMKKQGQLTREEVQQQTDTFMFEGHDTTATALQWLLYCLGRNVDCQRQCQQEIDQVVGDGPIDQEKCGELKYLEQCVKESQRRYPSVPVIGRMVTQPLKLDDVLTVPSGVSMTLLIYALHQDPHHFPDPDRFDPERFSAANSAGRHPFAYVPFSAGLRNCIGQKFAMLEEKIIAAHILRKFNVIAVTPEEKMRFEFNFVLRPTDGVWCKFVPRQ